MLVLYIRNSRNDVPVVSIRDSHVLIRAVCTFNEMKLNGDLQVLEEWFSFGTCIEYISYNDNIQGGLIPQIFKETPQKPKGYAIYYLMPNRLEIYPCSEISFTANNNKKSFIRLPINLKSNPHTWYILFFFVEYNLCQLHMKTAHI